MCCAEYCYLLYCNVTHGKMRFPFHSISTHVHILNSLLSACMCVCVCNCCWYRCIHPFKQRMISSEYNCFGSHCYKCMCLANALAPPHTQTTWRHATTGAFATFICIQDVNNEVQRQNDTCLDGEFIFEWVSCKWNGCEPKMLFGKKTYSHV